MLLLLVLAGCESKDGPPPAKFSVSGLGWLRDREERLSLERLLGDQRGETVKAGAVEDAMFLLMSAVQADGYLKAKIVIEAQDKDGRKVELTLDQSMATLVPRDLDAKTVRFRVETGLRYYYKSVKISGLHSIDAKAADEYFTGESAIFASKANRAYTPSRLTRSLDSLLADLHGRGFADADVRANYVHLDDATGRVDLEVVVKEGLPWRVSKVDVQGLGDTGVTIDRKTLSKYVSIPWADSVQQDVAGEIRRAFYEKGYPDVRVEVKREIDAQADHTDVALTATAYPGELVKVGTVRFEGVEKVKPSVLRRRVHIRREEPLNRLEIDQSRFRLSRLGVFERISLRYEPDTGPVRDPVFTLREGRTLETNLLFGYGSYEQLRGGVELKQFDLWGHAHQSRLLLVESQKSTRGDYTYTVPELFGETIDGNIRLFGLRRQEIAFLREEYGGTFTLSTAIPWLKANGTAAYTFQALRNRDDTLGTAAVDNEQVTVAAIDLGLSRDERDNPLRPRKGYRWFTKFELASKGLGGTAEYQRFEVGGSYHTRWGSGRWIHVALSHGLITTLGNNDTLLPVNVRFFPGGDSSIRGYTEGGASPRGPDGSYIGGKTYALANLDLEQALTSKWSVIAFGDALATSADLKHYPLGGEHLYSVGLGVHYQTLIGPIRLEYGHNLARRQGDPQGTWQITIGAPF